MSIQSIAASLPTQANPASSGVAREAHLANTAAKAIEASKTVQAAEPASRQQLETALKNIREFVEPINSDLEFSLDEDTGQTVVKIIDRATKEVIRQMPSEEMIAIAKALDNIKGLFVKQKA